jgi:hypothetical protein
MKQQTFIARTMLLLSAISFFTVSCNRPGKIRYNEERAAKHVISIKQAKRLQDSFIVRRQELSRLVQDTTFLSQKFFLSNSETFNRDAIALLLNQPGADSIRIYFGNDDNGKVRLILLPVDKNGKDIINKLISRKTALKIPGLSSAQAQDNNSVEDGEAIETGQICPPCSIQ